MLLQYIHRVAAGEHLSAADARDAMLAILNGDVSTAQIAAFLVALRMKGETAGELLGFTRALRERAARVDAGDGLLDTCGTGGGACTFNISTIAASVAAGAGVRVAKHGNRSFSSQCGSADILEELGLTVALAPERAASAIREIGIGFLFAPLMHPAMRHAQPARMELKMRTVFNLIGPLSNPAGARRQLIGAPSEEFAELMARALAGLEPERAFIVHGAGSLDEISTCGPTTVFEVLGAEVRKHTWTPRDFGVHKTNLDALAGGDRNANADIARRVLDGARGPHRDIVVVNAAAALMAAGLADTPVHAVALAEESIDSGAASEKLERLRAFSSSAAAATAQSFPT